MQIQVDPSSKARQGKYTLVCKVPQMAKIEPLLLPFVFTNSQKARRRLDQLRHDIEVSLEASMELCVCDSGCNRYSTRSRRLLRRLSSTLMRPWC